MTPLPTPCEGNMRSAISFLLFKIQNLEFLIAQRLHLDLCASAFDGAALPSQKRHRRARKAITPLPTPCEGNMRLAISFLLVKIQILTFLTAQRSHLDLRASVFGGAALPS